MPWACWLAAAALYFVVANLGLTTGFNTTTGSTPANVLAPVLVGVIAALVVLPAVFGDQSRGIIRGFLRSRPMVALGIISYGIYLWHYTYIRLSLQWVANGHLSPSMLVRLVVVLALTLGTATASYYLLERPCIRWSQRQGPQKQGRKPA